jgi:hypothetical protein
MTIRAAIDDQILARALGAYGNAAVSIHRHKVNSLDEEAGIWFGLFIRRPGYDWEMLCRRRTKAELLEAVKR